MAKGSKTRFKGQGGEITHQQHETDSPIIPDAQLERLHTFRPDIVDWVITETTTQANHRRASEKRINRFVFIERLLGQIFAFVIGMTGILGGACIAVNGQPWAGGIIASISISGLAAVFLKGRSDK